MVANLRGARRLRLSSAEFEDLVVAALDSLPEPLLELLDNVDVTIEQWPSQAQRGLASVGGGTLLGLYEGIPLTERHSSSYNLVVPDKVTIFQRPIEQMCRTQDEVVNQVRITVVHEIAHHFGIGEERLRELGWG
jgi:predicted Zn-dependent protease with MMP-like domain